MNSDVKSGSVAASQWTFMAIMSVALSIIIAALTFGTRPSLLPGQALMFKRLQVPRSVRELRSLSALKGVPFYAIDTVLLTPGGQSFAPGGNAQIAVTIGRGQAVAVTGWAGDPASFRPADGVALEVDGTSLLAARYGLERPDVAAAFGNSAFATTGFTVSIPPGYLNPGLHSVDLVMLNAYGDKYYKIICPFVLKQSS